MFINFTHTLCWFRSRLVLALHCTNHLTLAYLQCLLTSFFDSSFPGKKTKKWPKSKKTGPNSLTALKRIHMWLEKQEEKKEEKKEEEATQWVRFAQNNFCLILDSVFQAEIVKSRNKLLTVYFFLFCIWYIYSNLFISLILTLHPLMFSLWTYTSVYIHIRSWLTTEKKES